jgi:hypothetical protein
MEQSPPGPDPLAGVTDPWRFLAILKEQIEKRDRPSYINAFFDLLLREPPLHQDALIKEAAPIFGFTVTTGRKELWDRAKKARQGFEPEFRASVAEEGILAEQIYRPGDLEQQTGFLVTYWDKPDDPPVFLPEIELGRRKIYPLWVRMARDRMVYLPDSYEEYGTDEDLFQEIRAYLLTYVQVEATTAVEATAYILMTWVYDQFLEIPYFRAIGDYGVGKTRLITVVGLACYRPTLASGALTGPAIFRLIEQTKGTLVIDEADFEQTTDIHQDITKSLNVGFQQRYGVLRNEKVEGQTEFQVKSYQVFGPKVFATRRGFKDTALESRCFSHSLPLLDVSPHIPLYLDRSFDQHVQRLRNKLLLWRFRHWGHVDVHPFMRFPGMEPRLNQILLPLLAVTPTSALQTYIREEALRNTGDQAAQRLQTVEGQIVETVLWLWWHRPKGVTRILLKSLTERLQTTGERKDITSQKVSHILGKTLGIQTDYKGGSAWITLAPRQVLNLATSYRIEIPDEALLDLPDEMLHQVGLLFRKQVYLDAHPEMRPPEEPKKTTKRRAL